jgi:hypothetical protein
MTLEKVLSSAEASAQEVAHALTTADPLQLERCSAQLRDVAQLLAQALEHFGPLTPEQMAQVQVLASALARHREQLARVLALAGQRTATILPPENAPTYGATPSSVPRIYRAST